jgi:ABC-type lipoprotein release transport system permease subunit
MLIGADLAKDFGVGVGDTLTVLTRTKYSTYQALDLRIKGILLSNNYAIDMNAIVIPLGLAQRALDLGSGVTEVDVRLKDERKINEFKQRYTGKFPGTEVWTWKEVAEDVLAHSQSHAAGKYIIFIAVTLIALVGITNTVMIAVFERTREIGMMAAMGMKRRAIVTLFVLEGAMIGFLGSFIGCLVGISLVVVWTTRYGFDLSFAFKSFGNVGFRAGKFLGAWNPEIFLGAFIFGIVVSALASIYPALVASKLEPTEALRKG